MSAPQPESLSMIERLVRFDTTSRDSNLPLIEWVRDYLGGLGVDAELTYDEAGGKANLFATIGPAGTAGIVLSGHTDVVPVDGQDWSTDPFRATEQAGRLYGRGTTDMKSFLGVCLALVPRMLERELATPIHLALSYDEEVGCLGVRELLARLREREPLPRACIIGEPTGMRVVRAHKGKFSVRCHVRGLACHSALADRGVNAVEAAAEVITRLRAMARRCREEGPWDEAFDPAWTTVHTGTVRGGTALNIVPDACTFEFEFRHLPVQDPERLFAEVREFAERRLLPEMQAVSAQAGFEWERLATFPGLDTAEDSEVVTLAKHLAEANAASKVSFGTEGGLYQLDHIPTVVCGPGHIEQAHKPDEFIELGQVAACERFVARLIERLAR